MTISSNKPPISISKARLVLAVSIISLLAFPWAASAHTLPSAPKTGMNGGTIGSCSVFPVDNAWNIDISNAPVDPNSDNYISNINSNGSGTFLHPDFGQTPTYGIPYTTVPGTQALVPITFNGDGASQSDPGPYPIPPDAPVEAGSDAHVLVVDTDHCLLYELDNAQYLGGPTNGWSADWGAVFDLKANKLRPAGWTSADAAGLPIFAGLTRCAEVTAGAINHALRFTVNKTQAAYVFPARHLTTGYTGTNYPPMGLRFRLKSSYDTSSLTGQAAIIATALKKYGMMVADNGSNWYLSGDSNSTCWIDNDLNELKAIPGTAFEVVQSGLQSNRIGIYNNGAWWLRNANGTNFGNFGYGASGWIPVVGDWDGDGKSSIGIYNNGAWYLLNNDNQTLYTSFYYGGSGWLPVVGDWTGSGKTGIGIYQNGSWYLRDTPSGGASADHSLFYGGAGWLPVTGDWSSSGKTGIGIYQNGSWYLRNSLSYGTADYSFFYGAAGWLPVTGDWTGVHQTGMGIYQNGSWYLRNSLSYGTQDFSFYYGGPSWLPVIGDWNGPAALSGIRNIGSILTASTPNLTTFPPTFQPPVKRSTK